MAVPKKKMSRSRSRRRKATWRVSAPRLSPCPQCNTPRMSHRACPECGTYKGREILEA
jgi:large subunit ribosomal protein L32